MTEDEQAGAQLGLKQSRRLPAVERVTLAADHLPYGLVMSETNRRPRE